MQQTQQNHVFFCSRFLGHLKISPTKRNKQFHFVIHAFFSSSFLFCWLVFLLLYVLLFISVECISSICRYLTYAMLVTGSIAYFEHCTQIISFPFVSAPSAWTCLPISCLTYHCKTVIVINFRIIIQHCRD